MIDIEFALRDEQINIAAMTKGLLSNRNNHQIILCKKNIIPADRIGPFILDAKQTGTNYKLSESGREYRDQIRTYNHTLKYVAYVETYLKINIKLELFCTIKENEFFTVWDPESPFKYFAKLEEGFLVLFRVYELETTIPEKLLEKGRSGRNYYYRLSETVTSNVVKPIVKDIDYELMKSNLINLLKQKGWLIEIINTDYECPVIETYANCFWQVEILANGS